MAIFGQGAPGSKDREACHRIDSARHRDAILLDRPAGIAAHCAILTANRI